MVERLKGSSFNNKDGLKIKNDGDKKSDKRGKKQMVDHDLAKWDVVVYRGQW